MAPRPPGRHRDPYGSDRVLADRAEAGRLLGARLAGHEAVAVPAGERPLVLGLPRGGVPVAAEVARVLDADLDVIVVRKLGVPTRPELAMGAVGEGGVVVVNAEVVEAAGVGAAAFDAVRARESAELERRVALYRSGRPMTPLNGRTVVVVDDGIATGATARAALQVARAHGAHRVVLAVPVAAPDTLEQLTADADGIVALLAPPALSAVGWWYRDFSPVEDTEVVRLLTRGMHDRPT